MIPQSVDQETASLSSGESSSSALRLAVLACLLTGVTLYAWLGNVKREGDGRHRPGEAQATWASEVLAVPKGRDLCKNQGTAPLDEEELGYWLEVARVKEEAKLPVYRRLQAALVCQKSQKDSPTEREVIRARDRLGEELEAAILGLHLRLKRAQAARDRPEALRLIKRLRVYLEAHDGPLNQKLLRLERSHSLGI